MKIDRRLARKLYKIVSEGENPDLLPDFDQWMDQYVSLMVDRITLHPGRRAAIKDTHFDIEMRWQRSDKDGLPYIVSLSVEGPPGHHLNPRLEWLEIPLSGYWVALVLRLQQEVTIVEDDAPRPAAGKRPPLGHYQRILAEYDELVREGHPSPISVLADRYRTRPGTVKSWLHRGRKYLGEENSGTH